MEATQGVAVTAAAPDDQRAIVALIARSSEGDADAFGELYDRFQPEILRYLVHRVRDRETAEDLAQQVFLKAWQAIPRYEQRGLPFKAWLYRMAHNQMVDHYRTHRPTSDLDAERNERLGAALERLSEDHRRVLVLRFLMEKPAREIGEIMGRREVTVRGLQMRALRALRKEIETTGGMP